MSSLGALLFFLLACPVQLQCDGFCFILLHFCFVWLSFRSLLFLNERQKKGVDLDRRGGGEELEGVK